MAGRLHANALPLGRVQGNPGDESWPPMALSRERTRTMAAQPAGCQSEVPHPSAKSRGALFSILGGIAAIAETAAGRAYASALRVTRLARNRNQRSASKKALRTGDIMHDPYQSYQTLGAFSGGVNPFGLPYAAQ